MRTWLRVTIVFALVAAALTSCGDDDGAATPTTGADATSTTEGSTTTSSTSEPDTGSADVRVYFSRGERVATAGATVEAPAVARGAMEALLAGPDDLESDLGMTTAIPAGTELVDIAVEDGIAVVDLSEEFESGGGSLSMQVRVAQVVFTLTQFDTVDAVTFWIAGEPATDGIGGEGVPATEVDRGDLENVTPFVLVESPVPGEEVDSPLVVTGISNTYESNVLYTITGPDGTVLDEGFTTATAGGGEWGDFSFTSELDTGLAGTGTVVVFQEDANTGEGSDVYEVPVDLG